MILTAGASPASAGMISGVTVFGPNHGTGPGLGFVSLPVVSTPDVDNDNQLGGLGGDNNITVPFKRFNFPGFDIEFLVTDTSGVTEYKVFESVDNDTGVDWAQYRVEFGLRRRRGVCPIDSGRRT